MSNYDARQASNIIIEGFICPDCQQVMSSMEQLQAHFDYVHNQSSSLVSYSSSSSFNQEISAETTRSTLSSVIAKAKTLISSSFDTPGNPFQESKNPFLDSESDTNTSSDSNQTTVPNSPLAPSSVTNSVTKQFFNLNQSNGHVESHTEFFKKARDLSVGRYVVQTNKLLITLDKLISIDIDAYADEHKRDEQFKKIVSWVQDADVKLCPNCAKTFNLIIRKHHCRLCGAIMCNKCSSFLSFALAKQLTDPELFVKTITDNVNSSSDPEKQTEFRLRRSESINSVNSYFFKSPHHNHNHHHHSQTNNHSESQSLKKKLDLNQIFLRLCINCSTIVEKKYKSYREKLVRTQFAALYEELITCMNESKRLYSVYTKMAESLLAGEAVYQLSKAEETRGKLVRYFHQIKTLGDQILVHEPSTTKKDQLKLQRNINYLAINYLKEHSFSLVQLPSSEVYAELRAKCEKRLREESKRLELQEIKHKNEINKRIIHNQNNNTKNKVLNHNKPNVTIDKSNGWIPTSIQSRAALLFNDSDSEQEETFEFNEAYAAGEDNLDRKSVSSHKRAKSEKEKAIRIQIQLVEKYLDEALKLNKYEEADSLRRNLNELLNSLVDI